MIVKESVRNGIYNQQHKRALSPLFQVNRCNLKMEWDNWSISPIENLNPVGADEYDNKYDLQVDTLCGGQSMAYPHPWELGFQMNLNSNEIETVALERVYSYSMDVSFWADCTTENREGDPSEPYETWIANKNFSFSESFDCMLPEFDEEPIVLYGDEAAALINDLMVDVTMYGETPTGNLHCNSFERTIFDLMMDELDGDNCSLYIVAKAHDPTTQGTDGNMSTTQMVLDYKYTDTYGYGNSFINNDPLTCVIVIDKKPWASMEYGDDDRELVSNWPDPNYTQSDAGMWHDWCGEEIAINWWNLTDILLDDGGENIVGIKVRITDNTQQKPSGYHGNWRRSEDVMEQLGANSEVKIKFIDHNPHDGDANWKIVNYSGDTNDDFTSFIYTRDTAGVAETNIFVYLETEGHVDPRKPIQVTLKSSETDVPPDMLGNQVTINTYLMRGDDFDFFPGGRDRLSHLFGAQGDCTDCHFYHAILRVSDSKATHAGGLFLPVLYVSSSDHKFDDYEDKMDYSVSIAYRKHIMGDTYQYVNYGKFKFGKSRGVGYFEPDESDKKWYSYDEFLTSGGIEIVKVVGVESGYYLPEGEEFPKVPVQSEADVLLVIAHGVRDGQYEMAILGCEDKPGIETGFSHPEIPTALGTWHIQAEFHAAEDCLTCSPTIYTDYGYVQPVWNWWGDKEDKGNFWQKKSRPLEKKELRWLAAIGCSTLAMSTNINGNATGGPVLDWKDKITNGYLSSVCGFTADLTQHAVDFSTFDFVINGNLIKRYGENMKAIYNKGEIRVFEPTVPCFRFEPFWFDGSETTDISVAAWMEAACDLYGNKYSKEYYGNQDLDTACAIDQDNVTQQYHYWILEDCSKPYTRNGIHKYNVKIRRHDL